MKKKINKVSPYITTGIPKGKGRTALQELKELHKTIQKELKHPGSTGLSRLNI